MTQRRTATISGVSWKIGIFRKNSFYAHFADLIIHSSPLQAELHDGEQAHYDFAIYEPDGKTISGGQILNFQEFIIPKFRQFYPRISYGVWRGIWLQFMKIGVETTTGKRFEHRIDGALRRWLSKELRSSYLVPASPEGHAR